jgi:glycosyltransferase involved in cell wall biosynthesis
MSEPYVTIAIPSFNQGIFLEDALASIFRQEICTEVYVIDGGSSDNSIEIIRKWEHRLAGWRSYADSGQASAINEGIAQGKAPFVGWLNSDDLLLPGGLATLIQELIMHCNAPAVYGRSWTVKQKNGKRYPTWVEPFDEHRLAIRCIISQPATLIRRTAWESVDGIDESLHMAMDYDLWWRLFKKNGPIRFIDEFVAVNREHIATKTKRMRREHYREAIAVVRKHYGRVPMKWWLAQPYKVWVQTLLNSMLSKKKDGTLFQKF